MLKRFSLDDDFRDFYRREGYVVLTDLYTAEDLTLAREAIFALFARRLADVNDESLAEEPLLERHYNDEAGRWRECARRMWDLLPIYRLAATGNIEPALQKVGLATPIISTRPEVRTDMPEDAGYMQPWHQDWRYGQGSVNAVTIWTPLRDVTVENGTIDVMPGTHMLGYLETTELSNPRRFSIVDPRIDNLPYQPAELALGESILFSQMLVHRSGFNRSGRARVTVQTRFSDAADPAFMERGFPTPTDSTLVWDIAPGAEEMAVAFAEAPS